MIHDAKVIITVNPEGGYKMYSILGDGRNGIYKLKKEGNN